MKYHLIAPCYFGTESTAAFEVRRIGAEDVQVTDGRVAFTGGPEIIAAANLNLRCAERVLLLLKDLHRSVRKSLHPNSVQVVQVNGEAVQEQVLRNTAAYLTAYCVLMLGSFLLVSLDGFSVEANISAVFACFNNIGPGLAEVGPTSSFAAYSAFSKVILTLDMLFGRLEIFPMLALFSRHTWRRSL